MEPIVMADTFHAAIRPIETGPPTGVAHVGFHVGPTAYLVQGRDGKRAVKEIPAEGDRLLRFATPGDAASALESFLREDILGFAHAHGNITPQQMADSVARTMASFMAVRVPGEVFPNGTVDGQSYPIPGAKHA